LQKKLEVTSQAENRRGNVHFCTCPRQAVARQDGASATLVTPPADSIPELLDSRAAAKRSSYCVAVIDDDPSTRLVITDVLEAEGYQCLAWGSADGGIEKIEQLRPDALILDIALGSEKTGWLLLDQLCQNPNTAVFPVIICSAISFSAHQRQELFVERRLGYVEKPFNLDDLLETVADAVGRTDCSLLDGPSTSRP
jgi:CheY-like chemotaxis protein